MSRAWLRNFPGVENWKKILPVRSGWTQDEKYEIFTHHGEHYLLRVADESQMARKYAEFALVQRCQALGFPMPKPIACGLHAGRVYQLLGWVEGNSLAHELIGMPDSEQYRLGQEAGRALAAIHSVPLDHAERIQVQGEENRRKQILRQYLDSSVRMAGDEKTLAFVITHLSPVQRVAGLHGDFHVGNMVITPDGKFGLFDFNQCIVGDRWQEFDKAQAFSVPRSTAFVNGQIHGYFGGNPPASFWEVFAYQTAYNAIRQMVWAIPYGQQVIAQMQRSYVRAFDDFRGFMPCEPPRWYLDR